MLQRSQVQIQELQSIQANLETRLAAVTPNRPAVAQNETADLDISTPISEHVGMGIPREVADVETQAWGDADAEAVWQQRSQTLEAELQAARREIAALREEQEELLICLAEQDEITQARSRFSHFLHAVLPKQTTNV